MGLTFTGYVLEPPRVGQANSPFTFTPNVVIEDQGAFDAAYPADESAPRTEYLVFPIGDGDLADAFFAWTKNEVIPRFAYDGRNQRFWPMPGSAPTVLGTLAADANTTRLQATAPITTNFGSYPIRLSLGTGSGTTMTVATVANDGAFGTPAAGTVELSLESGNLNWNASDITTFLGQSVRFQQQVFFAYDASNGRLGTLADVLLLNPIPATGQFPLIRVGFGAFLTPIERANEGAFSADPTLGTVEWAATTGRLKFNAAFAAANADKVIYYIGSCFSVSAQLVPIPLGTVNVPSLLSPLPSEQSDAYFRVPGVVQFEETLFVDTLSLFGKKDRVEVRRSDGSVQFSIADRAAYGSQSVEAIVPDLPIERGMALRLFRTPVDPGATDPATKDISSLYTSTGATLASPIIGAPSIFLPSIPFETQPIVVEVTQGTGTFTGTLPRLDVAGPPAGLGYVLDLEAGQFKFARRKVNIVTTGSVRRPYGAVQLQDPMVFPSNLVLELETAPGSNVFSALTLNEDVVMDYNAGLATLVDTVGEVQATSSSGSFSGTTFTDATQDFTAQGVVSGDLLVALSGASKGVYTIDTVGTTTLTTDLPGTTESNLLYEIRHDQEILADRYFKEIPPVDPNTRVERLRSLGAATNAPRLAIPVDRITVSRFRRGKTTFMTHTVVANDGAFAAPGILAAGTLQVSATTGNLNFSTADLGQTIFWSRKLTLGSDYRLQPALGFIQFLERLLENEEAFITYAILDENDNKVIVEERASFLVRKELTADHPAPINTLSFNPLGREVAAVPAPKAFRGGRPQVTGAQVTFDIAASTVTFLPSNQVTDALPSGSIVQPNERVYIDYNVHEAIGGEDSVTVNQSPMLGITVVIEEGTASFTIGGNRTAEFGSNRLLRLDKSEVYLLGAPTYDSGTDLTTVNLAGSQTFRSDFRNPALAVTSGATRATGLPFLPSYFVTEMDPYDVPPRGTSKLYLVGDKSRVYTAGTVIHWTGSGVFDFNLVEGSTFDAATNRTVVVLSSNGARQYNPLAVTLKRSVRPILSSATASASTSRSPILTLPYLVFRRVEGQVGEVLVQPDDYEINEAGGVSFATPMQDDEALGIFYTGTTVIDDGRDFRASYTHLVVPTTANGLVGQTLKMDYTTYAPDSFYWRVETITNFRGELAEKYSDEAESTIPSGGPRLENSSGPTLFEQGRESLFYPEGRLANEDYVARTTLKFYNDGVNLLEDVLESMDGRVIGDHDGRFLFDGNTNNPQRTVLADVTNQIDDLLKVSDGPPVVTFPPFAISFAGTYKAMYKPSKFSRFYPLKRRLYGVAAAPTGLETGDTIVDLKFQQLAKVNQIRRRQPWAVVTAPAESGATTLTVDTTEGAEDLLRPPFDATNFDHRVAIVRQDGTFIVTELLPADVTGQTSTTLTLGAGVPSAVPVGATVYQVNFDLIPPATPFPKYYRVDFDVGTNLEEGVLTHIESFPPFDGTVPAIPVELEIAHPAGGEVLDASVDMSSSITEPDRFPALDGGTQDDDRNRRFPILNPSATSEGAAGIGYLDQEFGVIQNVTGSLFQLTTAPFVGTGDLDGTATIITNTGGAWPAPIPKVNDLVEIRTGLNALSGYYRITAVGASTITVATPFPQVDTGFTFAVTVSNTLALGAAGTVNPATLLTDGGANFLVDGVRPGHTLVITSGIFTGLRRQITAVTATTLTFVALPGNTVAGYRVDNSLLTFGGANSVRDAILIPSLDGELAVLDTNVPPDPYSEREGLEQFFDHFFTNIVASATGSTASTATLTDAAQDFVASGVNPSHFVFIRSGTTAGVYQVAGVTSPTTLDITETFPATASGISYRIVRSDGLVLKALQDAFGVLADIDAFITSTTDFRSIVTTLAPVVGDAGAFATRLLVADLNARELDVSDRISDMADPGAGPPAVISSVLSSSGKLYDKRFVWIDARVNLSSGILPKKERSVAERQKAAKDIKKQLTKILSTRP